MGTPLPVPPARLGKGTAKKCLKMCVTPAFIIVLETRVSDVRDERAGAYLCCLSATARLASLGHQAGLCRAGFAGDGHRQSLAGGKCCRRFCGLFRLALWDWLMWIPSLSRREMFVLKPARSQAAALAYFMRGLQIPRWRVV